MEANHYTSELLNILRVAASKGQVVKVKPFIMSDAEARETARLARVLYCRRPEGTMVFWPDELPIWFQVAMLDIESKAKDTRPRLPRHRYPM